MEASPLEEENPTNRARLRFALRSHLAGVRALTWHPTEHILFSGGEDTTAKMWNLSGATSGKKWEFGRFGHLVLEISLTHSINPQDAPRHRTSLHLPRSPSSHPLSHSDTNSNPNAHYILRGLFDPFMGSSQSCAGSLRAISLDTDEIRNASRTHGRRLVRPRPPFLRNHAIFGFRRSRWDCKSVERRKARACV
jgi:hypothetical protein